MPLVPDRQLGRLPVSLSLPLCEDAYSGAPVIQISKHLKPDDPVVLRVDQDHLCIGSYKVPCRKADSLEARKKPLPSDATKRISEALRYLEPFLIDGSDLTALAARTTQRGSPSWTREEQNMINAIGRVWASLAVLGVETEDLRNFINAAVHNAMTRKHRKSLERG